MGKKTYWMEQEKNATERNGRRNSTEQNGREYTMEQNGTAGSFSVCSTSVQSPFNAIRILFSLNGHPIVRIERGNFFMCTYIRHRLKRVSSLFWWRVNCRYGRWWYRRWKDTRHRWRCQMTLLLARLDCYRQRLRLCLLQFLNNLLLNVDFCSLVYLVKHTVRTLTLCFKLLHRMNLRYGKSPVQV